MEPWFLILCLVVQFLLGAITGINLSPVFLKRKHKALQKEYKSNLEKIYDKHTQIFVENTDKIVADQKNRFYGYLLVSAEPPKQNDRFH